MRMLHFVLNSVSKDELCESNYVNKQYLTKKKIRIIRVIRMKIRVIRIMLHEFYLRHLSAISLPLF